MRLCTNAAKEKPTLVRQIATTPLIAGPHKHASISSTINSLPHVSIKKQSYHKKKKKEHKSDNNKVGENHVRPLNNNMRLQKNAQSCTSNPNLVGRIAPTESKRAPSTHIHSFHQPAEDGVPPVQVRSGPEGNEELAAVRVRPGIGHRQQPSALVLADAQIKGLMGG